MRSTLRSLALVAMTIATLAGCTIFDAQPAIPSVELEMLEAPASLTEPGSPVSLSGHIAAVSAYHPWVIGGLARDDKQQWKPAYWTSTDAKQWTKSVLDEVEGRAAVGFDSSDELLVFAGTIWDEGLRRSILLTSDDAQTWRESALPADFAQHYQIDSFDVHGSEVIAIGADAAGSARGIRVVGDQVHEFDLPPFENEPFNAVTVVRSSQTVLLLASPGFDAEPQPTISFVSHNLGLRWQGPGHVADALDQISGVVAVDDGFVATGSVYVEGEDRSDHAAWFSADGLSWSREVTPASDQQWLNRHSGNSLLGVPHHWNGFVGATLTNSESLVNQAYRRSTDGTWTVDAVFNYNKGVGQAGAALHFDEFSVGLVTGSGGARIGRIENSRWRVTELMTERTDREVLVAALVMREGAILVSERQVFTSSPLSWSSQLTPAYYRVDGGTLVSTTLDTPTEVRDHWLARRGSEKVILGSDLGDGTARGWFRTGENDWVEVQGFSPDLFTTFREIIAWDEGWLAAGSTRATRDDHWTPTAWFSPNGVDWSTTKIPGSHDDVGVRWISGLCKSPDGQVFAVGTESQQDDRYRAVAWTVESEALVPVESAVFGEGNSYSGLCAENDDGMVARIASEGRPSLYWSADGATWEPTLIPEPGSSANTPIAVEGGLIALGHYQDGAFSSPVLWLSQDGKRWQPVQLPGIGTAAPNAAVQSGNDLLLLLDQPGVAPVAVIRDIAELIERMVP